MFSPLYEYGLRNKLLKELGYTDYQQYKKSATWHKITLRVFKKYEVSCFCCGSLAQCVHHNEYTIGNLTGETLEGLVPLCKGCHHFVEFANGIKMSVTEANERVNNLRQQNTKNKAMRGVFKFPKTTVKAPAVLRIERIKNQMKANKTRQAKLCESPYGPSRNNQSFQ